MNPTLDRRIIDQALKDDPIGARAEWKGEFREDTAALLPPELLDDLTVPGRLELPVVKGTTYFAFGDASSGRRDSFTLAISHLDPDSGKVILDLVREAKPPFRPEEVVRDFSEILKKYNVFQIECDRHAGEWVTDSFRRNSIHVENSSLSKSEIYLAALPIFSNGSLELLDNKRLRSQFLGLERRSRSGGKDQVDNFFGHDDLANVVAGACVLASQISSYRLPAPSLGISADEVSQEERLQKEMMDWLLDRKPKKRKQEHGEIDEEALIDEVLAWETEAEIEASKNTADDVQLVQGWKDDD